MKIAISKSYSLKVWLTSLLLAPIILGILTTISMWHSDFDSGIFGLMTYVLIFSIGFSTPAYAIFYFASQLLSFKSVIRAKIVLILINIFSMSLTLYLLFGKDSYNLKESYSGITFTLIYATSIIISGTFYRTS